VAVDFGMVPIEGRGLGWVRGPGAVVPEAVEARRDCGSVNEMIHLL
jgi:hypothetical protein